MAHVDTSMGRRVEVDAVFGKPAIPAQAVTRSKKRAEAARPRGKAWRCVYCVCVGKGLSASPCLPILNRRRQQRFAWLYLKRLWSPSLLRSA